MRYRDLPHYLNVQFADAARTYAAWCAAEAARKSYAGSLYWRQLNGVECLIQTSASGRQKKLGTRTAVTEAVYTEFISARKRAREQYKNLTGAMKQQQRVNKALRVGHLPNTWIRILNGIRSAGLADEVTVIGAAATYAYECAAGVRIDGDWNNAGETSVLSDRYKRLQLAVPGGASAIHVLAVIQHVAPAFQTCQGQRYTAIDHHGLEVEVLFDAAKAYPDGNNTADETRWRNQRRNFQWLLDAPKFRQTVAGANGAMTSMLTIDPRSFVLHGLALSRQPGRNDFERYRDSCLAKLVMAIVRDRIEVAGPPGETVKVESHG